MGAATSLLSLGRTIAYGRDNYGALNSIAVDSTTYANSFTYNAAEQLTAFTQGNGVAVTLGRSVDRLQLSSLSYVKSGATLFSLGYGYNPSGSTANNGQILSITDNVDAGRSAAYQYDSLHRLTSASTTGSTNYPTWSKTFSYDRYGNRLGIDTVSATTNRYASYGYDANGNLTSEPTPLNYGYGYDAENRLVSFNDGTTTSTYTYDGNDLRVKKVTGSNTTVYFYTGTDLAAEYLNGSLSRQYIYGPQGKLAQIAGSTTTYYGSDHLSKRLMTDASGNVVSSSSQGHYPFGEQWYGSSADREQFTTYQRDTESGNDYAIFRSYTSRIGRFLSPDPYDGSIDLGNPQSLNRYAYVFDNPVNWFDPLGLDPCTPGDYSGVICALRSFDRWWKQRLVRSQMLKKLDNKGESAKNLALVLLARAPAICSGGLFNFSGLSVKLGENASAGPFYLQDANFDWSKKGFEGRFSEGLLVEVSGKKVGAGGAYVAPQGAFTKSGQIELLLFLGQEVKPTGPARKLSQYLEFEGGAIVAFSPEGIAIGPYVQGKGKTSAAPAAGGGAYLTFTSAAHCVQ